MSGYLEEGIETPHGARPVHLILTMIKWIRTSRLSIKNSLFAVPGGQRHLIRTSLPHGCDFPWGGVAFPSVIRLAA